MITQEKYTATAELSELCALLLEKLVAPRSALLSHPVYHQLDNLTSLRIFMESHVFAVWDFMSLMKTLQQRLTCLDTPWLPPADIYSARLVNEIVLAEETDEVSKNFYISHFDLYIKAMEEIGANISPIQNFISSLRKGIQVDQALLSLPIPESTKAFVLFTMKTTTLSTHEVTAAFLFGREDIIPAMFRQIIGNLEKINRVSWDYLRLYLDRHNFLDEDQHVPMGKKLIQNLCGDDPIKWEQALHAASSALKARYSLWDGVSQLIQASR